MDNDPYFEEAIKWHPRKRPVSQSRKTGFLSVDALRERLSNGLPTRERLSIAQASRQMEILHTRLTTPPHPPALSKKAKTRVRKNHEASVALHLDRARAKESAKQEALEKTNFQLFGNFAKEHPLHKIRSSEDEPRGGHSILRNGDYLNDIKNTVSYDTRRKTTSGEDVDANWIKCRARGDADKYYYHNTLTGESRWMLDEYTLRKYHLEENRDREKREVLFEKTDDFEIGLKGIRNKNVQNNRLKSAPRGGRRDPVHRHSDGEEDGGRGVGKRVVYRPMSSPANLNQSKDVEFDLGEHHDEIVYDEVEDQVPTMENELYDDRPSYASRRENDENKRNARSSNQNNVLPPHDAFSDIPKNSDSSMRNFEKKKNEKRRHLMTANERRKHKVKETEDLIRRPGNKGHHPSKEEKERKKRLALLQASSFSLFVDRRRAPAEKEAERLEKEAQMKASAPPPIPPEHKRPPEPIKEQIVGDEEKSGSGLVSDWLKIPDVTRALLVKKRLVIVVACYDGSTSFNHPCVSERYKNSANFVINAIKEFTDDCAGISGYTIVEKSEVAGGLEIYAAVQSDAAVPPSSNIEQAPTKREASPPKYPHLVGRTARPPLATTPPPIKPLVERNIHTKLLFSKKLAGGWPDPRRCRRKLVHWLKHDVGLEVCSVAHSRAREAEKALTNQVHVNFPVKYLAKWVKVLDVPWGDGVRFEYEGPQVENTKNSDVQKNNVVMDLENSKNFPSSQSMKTTVGDSKRLSLKELKRQKKKRQSKEEISESEREEVGEDEVKLPFRVGGGLKHEDVYYVNNDHSTDDDDVGDCGGEMKQTLRRRRKLSKEKEKVALLMYKWRAAAHAVTAFNPQRDYNLATASKALQNLSDDSALKLSRGDVMEARVSFPTRTVHTCVIPQNVKHLLMGCADTSSIQQSQIGDKLVICAIAPPYHCFQACEGDGESHAYRGVRWHCRAPSAKGSGFGHEFGFSNSDNVSISEGRGDVWLHQRSEPKDDSKEKDSKIEGGDDGVTLSYSVEDEKKAGMVEDEEELKEIMEEVTPFSPFGAVARPLKNANRPKEFQRFKEHQAQQKLLNQAALAKTSEQQNMNQHPSVNRASDLDNRSNPRLVAQTNDPSWDRMSWGGAGGGRCGESLSTLCAPSHPWALGTRATMLQSTGLFLKGQVVTVVEYRVNKSEQIKRESEDISPNQSPNQKMKDEDVDVGEKGDDVVVSSLQGCSSTSIASNPYMYYMKGDDGSLDWLAASDHERLFCLSNFHDDKFQGLRKVIYIRLPDQLILPNGIPLEEFQSAERRLPCLVREPQDSDQSNEIYIPTINDDWSDGVERTEPLSVPLESDPVLAQEASQLLGRSMRSPHSTAGDVSYENDFYFEETYEEDFAAKNDVRNEKKEEEEGLDETILRLSNRESLDKKGRVPEEALIHQNLNVGLEELRKEEEAAAIILQCSARKHHAKQKFNKISDDVAVEAAKQVQDLHLRQEERALNLQQEAFEACHQAAMMVQAIWRQHQGQLNYAQKKVAVGKIQNVARQRHARNVVQELKAKHDDAAVSIKGLFRQKQAKDIVKAKHAEQMESAATSIQGLFRQKQAKDIATTKRDEKAKLAAQTHVKETMARREEQATVRIQSMARRKCAKEDARRRRGDREAAMKQHHRTQELQVEREQLVEKLSTCNGRDEVHSEQREKEFTEYKTAAAVLIQSTVRKRLATTKVRSLKSATTQRNHEIHVRSPLLEDKLLRTVGSVVEVRYRARFSWYRGVITKAYYDGSVDVKYDDGDEEVRVPRLRVRLEGQKEPKQLEPGTRVEARFNNAKQTYGGVIVNMWADGENYMIEYDDGDKEARVHRALIYAKCITVDDAGDLDRAAIKIQSSFRRHTTKKNYDRHTHELNSQLEPQKLIDDQTLLGDIEDELLRAVGSVVEVRYRARFSWYRGVITKAYYDGSVDVKYDDGDEEVRVPRLRVRLEGQKEPKQLEPGTRVEARFNNAKQTYGGVIVNMWADGENYMIEYDDGDKEARVHRALIYAKCITVDDAGDLDRAAIKIQSSFRRHTTKKNYDRHKHELNSQLEPQKLIDDQALLGDIEDELLRTVGSVVEVRYRARFSWYRGVITKAYYDGSVDVKYDDGDEEVRVPRLRVRLEGQKEPKQLEPGTRVEARFNNAKQTYGGVIVNMWADGENYMIEYDDGDKEARVHRALIYAKCITADVNLVEKEDCITELSPQVPMISQSKSGRFGPRGLSLQEEAFHGLNVSSGSTHLDVVESESRPMSLKKPKSLSIRASDVSISQYTKDFIDENETTIDSSSSTTTSVGLQTGKQLLQPSSQRQSYHQLISPLTNPATPNNLSEDYEKDFLDTTNGSRTTSPQQNLDTPLSIDGNSNIYEDDLLNMTCGTIPASPIQPISAPVRKGTSVREDDETVYEKDFMNVTGTVENEDDETIYEKDFMNVTGTVENEADETIYEKDFMNVTGTVENEDDETIYEKDFLNVTSGSIPSGMVEAPRRPIHELSHRLIDPDDAYLRNGSSTSISISNGSSSSTSSSDSCSNPRESD